MRVTKRMQKEGRLRRAAEHKKHRAWVARVLKEIAAAGEKFGTWELPVKIIVKDGMVDGMAWIPFYLTPMRGGKVELSLTVGFEGQTVRFKGIRLDTENLALLSTQLHERSLNPYPGMPVVFKVGK